MSNCLIATFVCKLDSTECSQSGRQHYLLKPVFVFCRGLRHRSGVSWRKPKIQITLISDYGRLTSRASVARAWTNRIENDLGRPGHGPARRLRRNVLYEDYDADDWLITTSRVCVRKDYRWAITSRTYVLFTHFSYIANIAEFWCFYYYVATFHKSVNKK